MLLALSLYDFNHLITQNPDNTNYTIRPLWENFPLRALYTSSGTFKESTVLELYNRLPWICGDIMSDKSLSHEAVKESVGE